MKVEVWERWISITGGAETALPCVQWHCAYLQESHCVYCIRSRGRASRPSWRDCGRRCRSDAVLGRPTSRCVVDQRDTGWLPRRRDTRPARSLCWLATSDLPFSRLNTQIRKDVHKLMCPLWAHQNRRATDYYTAIRWLVHWLLMDGLLHLLQRGGDWEGCGPAQSPPRCTKCNSPHINGQCTNFISFDVAL